MAKTKAVAKKQAAGVPAGVEMFDLKTNMEGVEPRLPQIAIAHQAQMFVFSKPSPTGSKNHHINHADSQSPQSEPSSRRCPLGRFGVFL